MVVALAGGGGLSEAREDGGGGAAGAPGEPFLRSARRGLHLGARPGLRVGLPDHPRLDKRQYLGVPPEARRPRLPRLERRALGGAQVDALDGEARVGAGVPHDDPPALVARHRQPAGEVGREGEHLPARGPGVGRGGMAAAREQRAAGDGDDVARARDVVAVVVGV